MTARSERSLSAHEQLRAMVGLSPSALLRRGYEPDAWHDWDKRYGPLFRLAHGIAMRDDVERAAEMPEQVGPLPPPPGA